MAIRSQNSQDAIWRSLSHEAVEVPSSQESDMDIAAENGREEDTRLSKNPSLLRNAFLRLSEILPTSQEAGDGPAEDDAADAELQEDEEELVRALSYEMVNIPVDASSSQSQSSQRRDSRGLGIADVEESRQQRAGRSRGGGKQGNGDDQDDDEEDDEEEEEDAGWKDDERDGDFVESTKVRLPRRRSSGRRPGANKQPRRFSDDGYNNSGYTSSRHWDDARQEEQPESQALAPAHARETPVVVAEAVAVVEEPSPGPPPPQLAIQASFVPQAPVMLESGRLMMPAQAREEKEATAALDELFRAASDDFQHLDSRGRQVGSDQSSVPLRRADLPPVCDRCRRLHRKCDRLMPCSECRMRNSNCTTGGARRIMQGSSNSGENLANGAATAGNAATGKPPTKYRKPAPKIDFSSHSSAAESKRVEPDTGSHETEMQPKKKRVVERAPPAGQSTKKTPTKGSPRAPALGVPAMVADQAAAPSLRPMDPEILLPDPRNRISLSDVTLAFLPGGMGIMDECDPCTAAGKMCDRRNPCSECILVGNELGCVRKRAKKAVKKEKE